MIIEAFLIKPLGPRLIKSHVSWFSFILLIERKYRLILRIVWGSYVADAQSVCRKHIKILLRNLYLGMILGRYTV